jgi:dTDP-glucose 4,6-dehydratase
MKNMLITGGCGFIGSNFIRYLLRESDYTGRIINLDKLTYAGNRENLADVEKEYSDRYIFIQADICDATRMEEIFDGYRIDGVCHFAAESHVDRSIVKPDAFVQTNIVGTFNLLEAARSRLARMVRFHHVSTDEVYGSLGREGHFTETTSYQPNSPYSASKASSDHLVRAYHKTYGLPISISNCSNNYGPYQFPEKLVPLMILNGIEGKSLPVYGDGQNVRDWLHVRDHCMAVWMIMKHGTVGETYNIGGNGEIENIRLVEIICDILDDIQRLPNYRGRRDLIEFVKDRPGHDLRYAIDCSKLKQALNWRPEISLETGIRETINWYLQNRQWVDRVKSGEYQTWIKSHYG